MFSSGVTGGDLGSSVLSRVEQKLLYAAGVFFLLTIVFSAFSIASTIFSTVSLSGSLEKSIAAGMGATLFVAGLFGCLFGAFFWMRADKRAATESPEM